MDCVCKQADYILEFVVMLYPYLVVYGISFYNIVFQYSVCPNAELCTTFALYTITDRDNDIKVVIFSVSCLRTSFPATKFFGMCNFCTYLP